MPCPIRRVGKPPLTGRMPTRVRFLPRVHPNVKIKSFFGAEFFRTVLTFPGEVLAVDVPVVALHEGDVAEDKLAVGFGTRDRLEGGVDFAVVFENRKLVEGLAAGFADVDRRGHAVGALLVVAETMQFEELGVAQRAGEFAALPFVGLMLVQFGGVFEGSLAGLADEGRVGLRGMGEGVFAAFVIVGLVDVFQEFLFG